jgi:peptidoglycan/xylan/chitin deacetylase (PgdA/CDA1 family)
MSGRTAARKRHPLDGLLTVMWHYVRDDVTTPLVGAGRVHPDAFERQLDLIADHRTVVSWAAVARALAGGPALPRDAALLTFDDGLVDHHRTVGPRLAARGWSGVFFATARQPGERLSVGHRIHILLAGRSPNDLRAAILDRLGPADRARFHAAEDRERASGVGEIDVLKRPIQRDLSAVVGPVLSALIEESLGPEADVADALLLSPADVAGLRQAGMTIGGHGRRHLWFDWASPDEVAREIADSAAWLASEPTPWAFAYPYGAAGAEAPASLAAAGFAAAFHASPTRASGRYDLGRVDAEDRSFEQSLASGSVG